VLVGAEAGGHPLGEIACPGEEFVQSHGQGAPVDPRVRAQQAVGRGAERLVHVVSGKVRADLDRDGLGQVTGVDDLSAGGGVRDEPALDQPVRGSRVAYRETSVYVFGVR
jgi:hypothetical protein